MRGGGGEGVLSPTLITLMLRGRLITGVERREFDGMTNGDLAKASREGPNYARAPLKVSACRTETSSIGAGTEGIVMKRALVTVMVGLTILVGTAVPAQAVDRVRCEIPSNYRIVCFNYTPYIVRVRVNIFTTNGLYVRYIKIPYTRKVVYSPAYINRITWRWWWA